LSRDILHRDILHRKAGAGDAVGKGKVVIPIRKHQLLLNLPSCVVQEESNIQLYWQAREYKIIGQESRKGSDLPLTVR